MLGPFSDDASRSTASGTRLVPTERNVGGAFRTPGLRDAALTAPYMHDGSLATLCDVVHRHPAIDASGVAADAGPIKLSPDEGRDLVAFVQTLTAESAKQFPNDTSPACR